MPIKVLTQEWVQGWNSFVTNSSEATIYHTLEWKEVARAFGHEPLYILSVSEENNRVEGILPLYYVKNLFGRRMVSVSMRDKGGPLYSNQQSLSELLKFAIELTKERKCNYLELKGASPLSKSVADDLGLKQKEFFVVTQIEIDAVKEKMWNKLHQKSVRWAINKSKKEGVRVHWLNTIRGIEEFYRLFVSTRHRLGIPVFSYRLFENIHKNLIQQGWAGCILAEYRKRFIGGIIFFSYKGTIIEAYAAADQRFWSLRPNNLLIWELLCWGADKGFHIFDMGCDTVHNKGLLEFKSRWGGTQRFMPYYYYFRRESIIPDPGSPRFEILRNVWRLLPEFATSKIGPFWANQMS